MNIILILAYLVPVSTLQLWFFYLGWVVSDSVCMSMYKSDKNKEMVSWVIQLCVYALGLSHSHSNVCACARVCMGVNYILYLGWIRY